MSQPFYTDAQIFRHMTPFTIAAWVSDLDEAIIMEATDDADMALMYSAICELFALVGLEALNMLGAHGFDASHPLVQAALEAYNEA